MSSAPPCHRAHLIEHAMYVDDGQILSSGGMLASADLCLYLLSQDHGQAYANDVSRVLINPPHRTGGQAQYAKAAPPPSGPLSPVLDWIDEHIVEPLTLQQVALQAHMSPRTFERRFRTETGETLVGWIARRRVEQAQALLERTELTVTEVAHGPGSAPPSRCVGISSARPAPRRGPTVIHSAARRPGRHEPCADLCLRWS